MDTLKLILNSRKFWLLLFGVIQTAVSLYLKIDPTLWASIDALVVGVIGALFADDITKLSREIKAVKSVFHIHKQDNP